MTKISIIMPMAGRGSRFMKQGIMQPKPLILLDEKPFFWWAIESIRKDVEIDELIFIVLKEHIKDFAIDSEIYKYYKNAQIIALDQVTSGAAETAAIGIKNLKSNSPFLVQDCDHAFIAKGLDNLIASLGNGIDGALIGFQSKSANYSFVKMRDNLVEKTVEKQAISPFAIAGCYFFACPEIFLQAYEKYMKNCQYDEAFMSGIYNILCDEGYKITYQELAHHFSFGTPEELEKLDIKNLLNLWNGNHNAD